MGDKRTPMEAAEVLEMPETIKTGKASQPKDTYGTAMPEKPKKNHDGLIISLCVLTVVLGSFFVFVRLLRVELGWKNGKLIVTLDGKADLSDSQPGPEYVDLKPEDGNVQPPVQSNDHTEDQAELVLKNPYGAEGGQTAQTVYAKVSPSVVCVVAETYYGQVTGTGIILTEGGYILTTDEVTSNAMSIAVVFSDGTEAEASQFASDADTGFVLLKTEREGLTAAEFAGIGNLAVGDTVYTIANPYGSKLRNVLGIGVVSAISDEVTLGDSSLTMLQTTASFGSGNNGCPVIDSSGRVVAVTSSLGVYLTDDGSDPNLAVSMEGVKQVVEAMMDVGYTAQSVWLGFTVTEIPFVYCDYYEYPGSLWISEVGSGTLASGMLYPYDVITAVDGQSVETVEEFQAALAGHSIGDSVTLTIFRANRWYRAVLPLTTK